MTIGGKPHAVRWGKQVQPDGSCRGEGVLAKPDGSEVPLASTGATDGQETITGTDAGAGIQITVTATSSADAAAATIDGGAEGAADLAVATEATED